MRKAVSDEKTPIKDVMKKFIKNFQKAQDKVVERDKAIMAIAYAILTKNHVMFMGKPGIAKSMLARLVFDCFKPDVKQFRLTCTKRMTEEYIVGPLDMKLFREKGTYHHITEGSIIDCHLAFLDEFLDLPDQASRALLEVLNERTFSRGKQRETSTLMTAVAATNFSPSAETLEAVQDRFLFRMQVNPLAKVASVVRMLETCQSKPEPVPEENKITMAELRRLQLAVSKVYIDPIMFEQYATMATECRNSGLNVTDRRINWTLDAVRANAFIFGRRYALPQDFTTACEMTMMTVGMSDQEQKFAKCAAGYQQSISGYDDLITAFHKTESLLDSINSAVAKKVALTKGQKTEYKVFLTRVLEVMETDPTSQAMHPYQEKNQALKKAVTETMKTL